jgi:hypothetical protein
MFRRICFLAALFAASVSEAQVTVTQQPGALVSARQSVAPAAWACYPTPAAIIQPKGVEWKAFVLPGTYSVLAVAADGTIAGRTVVVSGVGPGPQPKPDPNPNPDPQPDPTPVPGPISAAIVTDPANPAAGTSQQVAARVSPEATRYMAQQGYRFRQFVGAPLDAKGAPAASEAFFVQQAAKLGEYPAIVIGTSGSNVPKAVSQVTDGRSLLTLLKQWGGPPKQEQPVKPFIDIDKIKVDAPAPAGVSMGLIPMRKINPIRLTPLAAAGIPDIPESEWFAFYQQQPKTILSEWVPYVDDQDGLGACAAFAAGNAVEIAEAVAGLPPKKLAKFCLYSLVAYPRDSGSGLDENAETVETVGIPEVEFSPTFAGTGGWSNSNNWPAGWKDNAAKHRCKVIDLGGNSSSEAWHNLVVMLLRGIPCTIGVSWPGGHSIVAVAPVFTGPSCTGILIVNSWGPDDGDNGRYVRSKSNVVDGINTFGGPFAYITPTFPQDPKVEPKPNDEPARCPDGRCPFNVAL